MNDETPSPHKPAPIALDGPSALTWYRDRCDLAETLAKPMVSTHFRRARNQSRDEAYWLSDENVAATLAEANVFGRRAFEGESMRTRNNELPQLARTRSRGFSRCSGNSSDIKQIAFDDLGIRPPTQSSPLFVIVGKRGAKRVVANVRERSCSTHVPHQSLRRLGKHVYVPTPELTFLLLAKHLTLIELIMVGMELCGHYRLVGAESRELLRSNRTLYNQRPLTTHDRLLDCIDYAQRFAGVAAAQRSCQYIAASSASPMETAVFLLLCLPRNMGGYALPWPILNAKCAVSHSAEAFTMSHCLIPDLYWPTAKVDVEYDSEEFHSNPDSLEAGARRALALRAMNVDVISLTRDIVYDVVAFDAMARMLGKKLGKRMAGPSSAFIERRQALRSALLLS